MQTLNTGLALNSGEMLIMRRTSALRVQIKSIIKVDKATTTAEDNPPLTDDTDDGKWIYQRQVEAHVDESLSNAIYSSICSRTNYNATVDSLITYLKLQLYN